MRNLGTYDLVVVGAGIVGLAHAYHAVERGLTVAVVDQATGVAGASVQNFGHACITAQSGPAREFAIAGRRHWLDLSAKAGFWSAESGTYCVARHADEQAVIDAFAALRGPAEVRQLTRAELLDAVPVADDRVTGGMYLPADLQVDPRAAAPAVARWLARAGVQFYWRTAACGFDTGLVHTSRGTLAAEHVVVAVNHDVDRLFPEPAERDGLLRCRLHMLRARIDLPRPLPAPLFTGWSLLRYSAFEGLPGTDAVARRLSEDYPDHVAIDLHQMYTPQPDGSILVGDTHVREISTEPFQSERGFATLLEEAAILFGTNDITVTERWQGVYCSAPNTEFLLEEPIPGVHVATVTTGIGMTTSMGLAEHRLASILDRVPATV
ncbi:MAG TPA: TIGR03364 family FAD-dependent oxidoreductase [Aldersonia sp.]